MTDPSRVLVVGSGIAGLTFALKVARHLPVLVITKKRRADSNTNFARGGIAAAGLGPDDDPELHLRDTLDAGAGLTDQEVAEVVVREGVERVRELVDWGVRFRREGARFSLGMEGGHSRRRILHAGDRTGKEIERALLEAVARDENIQVLEHFLAVDLLVTRVGGQDVCRGVLALDHRKGELRSLTASTTFLATGGSGQLFLHTTNPRIATGDGVAMAYRAGAPVANMEFIQFHPTALYPTENPAFLLSEALRGEGAVLRRRDGTPFMEEYDPRGSLAPRDVVARAIHAEMKDRGESHVVLDVSALPPEDFEARFPGAAEGCRSRDIDPHADGIPVVPAAHYICGGVRTDLWGRTELAGLFAAGEVAHTGIHGANRLASNSLLEAVVFSHRAAEFLTGASGPEPIHTHTEAPRNPERDPEATGPAGISWPEEPNGGVAADEPPLEHLEALRIRLQRLMWEKVGIVRSDRELKEATEGVAALRQEVEELWKGSPRSVEGVELENLLTTAELVVRSARSRKESRGLHYNRDHPQADDHRFSRDTVLRRSTTI